MLYFPKQLADVAKDRPVVSLDDLLKSTEAVASAEASAVGLTMEGAVDDV